MTDEDPDYSQPQAESEAAKPVPMQDRSISSAQSLAALAAQNSPLRYLTEITRQQREVLRGITEPAERFASLAKSLSDVASALKVAAPTEEFKSIASAITASLDSPTLREMTEKGQQVQKLLGPDLSLLENARLAGLTDLASVVSMSEWTHLRSIAESFEARFRLPEMPELARFAEQMKNANSVVAAHQADIQRAMEAMKTPWVDIANAMQSARGFAELQSIGLALRTHNAYDDDLSALIRQNLGDWRDTITWPESIFTDFAARTEFYLDRGLNQQLTDFPVDAFRDTLSLAGFSAAPSLAEDYANAEEVERGAEEEGFARTNAAHATLLRFETQLRRFIEGRMVAAFGSDWLKQRVPGPMRDQWIDKQHKAREYGEAEHPLIAYADFTDYVKIITRADNWNVVFKGVFRRAEFVQESLQRLYPIRLCTMHARIITQDDELYLQAETTRILRAIGALEGY